MKEENNKQEDVVDQSAVNPKFKLIKIPRQDFRSNRLAVRPYLDQQIVRDLKEVFNLFSTDYKVNPHDIKNGVRSVSKNIY